MDDRDEAESGTGTQQAAGAAPKVDEDGKTPEQLRAELTAEYVSLAGQLKRLGGNPPTVTKSASVPQLRSAINKMNHDSHEAAANGLQATA